MNDKDLVIVIGKRKIFNEIIQKILFDFGYIWDGGFDKKLIWPWEYNNYKMEEYSIKCDVKNKLLRWDSKQNFLDAHSNTCVYCHVGDFEFFIDYLSNINNIPPKPTNIVTATSDILVTPITICTDGCISWQTARNYLNSATMDNIITQRTKLLADVKEWDEKYGQK